LSAIHQQHKVKDVELNQAAPLAQLDFFCLKS
jgi:hypothetical protein